VKPIASLSLDLDNEWSYLKTHGDPGWEAYPTYLGAVVPRVLEMLSRHALRITFFVVGQDAALAKNGEAFAQLADSEHEIGNHSLRHEPWLHLYSEAELESELAEAEAHIEAATRRRPVGFRGPGFSLSETTLRVLHRRGYRYDASTLPTFLGPLARAYYFMTARMEAEERRKRSMLFGSWREGLRPLGPYRWRLTEGTLLEIPVTTLPGLRLPIHISYVLYLASFSRVAARAYFGTALRLCRAARVEPSILLHPLDFLGGEDVPSLGFFPAMHMPAAAKLAMVDECLDRMQSHFEVRTLGEHAEAVTARSDLPQLEPRFDRGGALRAD
jgi:hypothetical protein